MRRWRVLMSSLRIECKTEGRRWCLKLGFSALKITFRVMFHVRKGCINMLQWSLLSVDIAKLLLH
jgi:hypothetical protein